MDIPGEPAPWLHRHPSEQRLLGYYGPVRQRAPQLVLSASGFCRWQAPSRDHHEPRSPFRRSPSHVPCKSRRPGSRRLYAGHHLARNAGTRQAHPGRNTRPPGFDAISDLSTPQQRTPTRRPRADASGTSSWSPPDAITATPFPWTLTTTVFSQRSTRAVWRLPPQDRRWRANKPPSLAQHRLYEGFSTRLLLRRS